MRHTALSTAIHEMDSHIFIGGKWYIPYLSFVGILGISSHANQLLKRKAKYPDRFLVVQGRDFVELEYAFAIARFHQSLAHLSHLQKSAQNGNG